MDAQTWYDRFMKHDVPPYIYLLNIRSENVQRLREIIAHDPENPRHMVIRALLIHNDYYRYSDKYHDELVHLCNRAQLLGDNEALLVLTSHMKRERALPILPPRDRIQALADQGNIHARARLATYYYHNYDNKQSAETEWRSAAELGDPYAICMCGMLERERCNISASNELYQRAANLGDISALYELAYNICYYSPNGCLRCMRYDERAVNLCKQAIELGFYKQPACILAEIYRNTNDIDGLTYIHTASMHVVKPNPYTIALRKGMFVRNDSSGYLIAILYARMREMDAEIARLKEQVIALTFAPGGPEFRAAERDWNERTKKMGCQSMPADR